MALTAYIGKIVAEEITTDALYAAFAELIVLKAGTITADNIQTDALAAELARITVLSCGSATFDRATVQHLVSEAMNLEYGVAGQVFIKNLAVEYAQMIGATIGNPSSAGAREGASALTASAYCAEYGIELTAGHYDQLREFYEQGITDDMLRYAVDESVANSKPGWAYVRKCVDAWISKGYKTLDQVKAAKKAEAPKGCQDPPNKPPDRDAPPAPKPRFFSEGWDKK